MREEGAEVIVIGSGFGGTAAAHVLLEAGHDVLMLERGTWPSRDPRAVFAPRGGLDPRFTCDLPYHAPGNGKRHVAGPCFCVGGPSVFFAAVSSRLRVADFAPPPEIVGLSGAEWPFTYEEIEPWYGMAERFLGVAGESGVDPTEPPRSQAFPQALPPLAPVSARLADAAAALGLRPFRLPLAINFGLDRNRFSCTSCAYCDGFPCTIGAKNDHAGASLPRLLQRGLRLRTEMVAVRFHANDDRIMAVEVCDGRSGERLRFRAEAFVLAAGALASGHVLLESRLHEREPGGRTVGHYLMRHCNAHVFGIFGHRPDPDRRFHKQIGLHDFYFGHPTVRSPPGKLGGIQQMATPTVLAQMVPARLARAVHPLIDHVTGFIVMAEDQPVFENCLALNTGRHDRFGMAQLSVLHRHSPRDLAARQALIRQARRVLRKAGALGSVIYPIRTFSHAVGTARMGRDPENSALDGFCRFRGVDNLWVADGSALPTSGAVNPSLSIAAVALRAAADTSRFLSRARRPSERPGTACLEFAAVR
jgi:choline dehydrogenase-like flavoprotein